MPEYKFKYCLEELEVEIDGYASPYDPGRVSGPPENCYPPDGGFSEDISVYLTKTDENGKVTRLDITEFISNDEYVRLCDIHYESYCQSENDACEI